VMIDVKQRLVVEELNGGARSRLSVKEDWLSKLGAQISKGLIAQFSEYADNKRQQSQQNLFKKESILIQKRRVEI
jgi:hypothetical protein